MAARGYEFYLLSKWRKSGHHSTWAFCLSMREGNRIIRVRRHCYFERAARGFLNGRSTLLKIFCQER